MENEKRIPRVRLLESEFPTKIAETIEDKFLEVINLKGEVLCLLFLFSDLDNKEFKNVTELVQYFDEVNICREDYSTWQLEEFLIRELMEKYGETDRDQVFENLADPIAEYYDSRIYSMFGDFFNVLVCYGRLRYPIELKKSLQIEYESALSDLFEHFLEYSYFDNFVFDNEFRDDWVDITNFLLKFFGIEEFIHGIGYEFFINLDLEVFGQIAENLLTRDNIGSFIETASNLQNSEMVAFLLDYQNQHFQDDKSSLQLE